MFITRKKWYDREKLQKTELIIEQKYTTKPKQHKKKHCVWKTLEISWNNSLQISYLRSNCNAEWVSMALKKKKISKCSKSQALIIIINSYFCLLMFEAL